MKVFTRARRRRRGDGALVSGLGATESFQISYRRIGPTEWRAGVIVVNAALVKWGLDPMVTALPYVAGVVTIWLVMMVVQAQRVIWQLDTASRAARPGNQPAATRSPGPLIRQEQA